MSKRGDIYLRTLLIHGVALVRRSLGHARGSCAAGSMPVFRRNKNVAAVALANKNARIAWALLAHQHRQFDPDYVSTAPSR